ncbi:phosphoglycerate mutase family protein [Aspergillus arachidicola]|uniref:Phosphoglycerate mutase family protein n=2 Tax=Aspergillus arachidicola TaxID=656916 RepID=A0A2G7FR81_9EURO|nr:phosphoglycerate mutase family protein [Aspergillus arachidicola]
MLLSYYLLAAAATAMASPTVYLIRHGEKPDDGGDGLSAQGVQRAQCLRSVFGKDSKYNIGYIMAQTPKKSGKRTRPYETVLPLAEDLGLTVDTSCDRDDPKCVKKAVEEYKGDGNILICWQHEALTDIVKKLGAKDAPEYPSDRFDLIWTDPSPYTEITETTSEQCPGLDS